MNIKELIKRYDGSDYLRFLSQFPDQLKKASKINLLSFPRDLITKIRNITIAGMGGSAIGGEILGSLYRDELKIPITVCRDYKLPAYIDDNALVVVSSYSGNTEETLSCFKEAAGKGAVMLCITTGGLLTTLAEENKAFVITIPEGYQPRAALGFSLIPIIRFLSICSMIPNQDEYIGECIDVISSLSYEYSPEYSSGNKIIELAEMLTGHIPVIYAPGPPLDCLATRWRCQFTENAKILAFGNSFPELNHNEIMGWAENTPCLDKYFVIFLRDVEEPENIKRRIEITREVIAGYGVKSVEIRSAGIGKLSRMMSLLYYGDYLSFYYAVINNTDPTPIENISYLKQQLSK